LKKDNEALRDRVSQLETHHHDQRYKELIADALAPVWDALTSIDTEPRNENTELQKTVTEDDILKIAEELKNEGWDKQTQTEKARRIAEKLVTKGLKEKNYKLDKSYITNWMKDQKYPKPNSLHHLASLVFKELTN
jgi:ferric iron reductase protein FhuF